MRCVATFAFDTTDIACSLNDTPPVHAFATSTRCVQQTLQCDCDQPRPINIAKHWGLPSAPAQDVEGWSPMSIQPASALLWPHAVDVWRPSAQVREVFKLLVDGSASIRHAATDLAAELLAEQGRHFLEAVCSALHLQSAVVRTLLTLSVSF